MRTALRITLLAAAACLVLAGCNNGPRDAVDEIKKRGSLRVAVPEGDGDPEGRAGEELEKRVLESLAESLEVDIRYETAKEADLEAMVSQGTTDVAVGIPVMTDSRKDNCSLTYGRRPVYMATDENTYITGLSDLGNSSVGFSPALDSDIKTVFFPVPGIEIADYTSLEQAIADIRGGRIKAYICKGGEARALLEEDGLTVQDMVGINRDVYTIMTANGQHRLLSMINELLTRELAD